MLPEPLLPTDIDGLIEWRDKAYIIIEVKKEGTPLHRGQKLAIERMVRDFQRLGKEACAILVMHNVFDVQKSVFVAEHRVTAVYNGKAWRQPKTACSAGEFVRATLDFYERGRNGNHHR